MEYLTHLPRRRWGTSPHLVMLHNLRGLIARASAAWLGVSSKTGAAFAPGWSLLSIVALPAVRTRIESFFDCFNAK